MGDAVPSTPLVLRLGDVAPTAEGGVWIAPGAVVVGQVRLRAGSSIWYGAVVRGDEELIELGPSSNVQDNCVLHADAGIPTLVGADVTIGHNATVHGARVGDRVLIGMNAVLLNGCVIGTESIIGAGAVVPEGMQVPPRSLVLGLPARVHRELTDQEIANILTSALGYRARAERHRAATKKAKDAEAQDGLGPGRSGPGPCRSE